MEVLLSLETSTDVCSVAIHKDEILILDHNLSLPKAHSAALPTMVKNALNHASIEMSQISAMAVSLGPGSYTGLRIGVSFAKGLCFALGLPVVGVSTLHAMANDYAGHYTDGYFLCPMIDARRMEVYSFISDYQGRQEEEICSKVVDANSFTSYTKNSKKVVLFGSGAAKFSELFQVNPDVIVVDNYRISARSIGELGWAKFKRGEFEDLAYFEPFYLKEFIAGKPKTLV